MSNDRFSDYTLSSYDPAVVELPSFEVSDEEVTAEMQRVAMRHAYKKTIEAHPICADDCVHVNITTTENGMPFGGLTHEGVDIQLGVGEIPLEIELALLGKNVGETIHVEYELDETASANCGEVSACSTSDNDQQTGKLSSTVEIVELRKRVAPEITDEWVKKNVALSNTVQEFKERTEKRLFDKKRREYLHEAPHQVMEVLGKRLVENLPSEIVEQVASQLEKEFERFLINYDMDYAMYLATHGITHEEFQAQLLADAYERVSQDVALMAYAKHHGIAVSERDIDATFLQPTPEKTYDARKEAEQRGELRQIRDLALRAKTAEVATQNARFVNAQGEEDTVLAAELDDLFKKREAVRNHATSEPMKVQLGVD